MNRPAPSATQIAAAARIAQIRAEQARAAATPPPPPAPLTRPQAAWVYAKLSSPVIAFGLLLALVAYLTDATTLVILLVILAVQGVVMYANGFFDGPERKPRRQHWIWKYLR
jgi:hypothetical protein